MAVVKTLRAGFSLYRGQSALLEGDLEGARGSLAGAVEARPRWDKPRLWLALAQSELGELSGALEQLERAASLASDDTVARLWRARVLLDHQRFEEALEALEALEARATRNLLIPGYLKLARWAAQGDDALAEGGWELPEVTGSELQGRWLVEIETRFPGGPGTEYFVQREPPRGPLQRLSRWRALRLEERARRAIEGEDYLRGLEALDGSQALWFGEASTMELRLRAHLGASHERREALERSPHDVDLRLELAEDLLEIGLPREALEVLEPVDEMIESVDKDRLSWKAGASLLHGRALMDLGRSEEALVLLELSRELWSVEVEPHYSLAIANLALGKRAEGRRAMIGACDLDSELAGFRLLEYRAAVEGG